MSVCREILVPAAEPSARGSFLPPCCLSSRLLPPSGPCDAAVPISGASLQAPRLLQTFTSVLCPGRSPADMCSPCLCCGDSPHPMAAVPKLFLECRFQHPWRACATQILPALSLASAGEQVTWPRQSSSSDGCPPSRWFCPPQHRALWQLGAKSGHLPAEDRNSVLSPRLSAEPPPLTFLPLDRSPQPWRDPVQSVGSVGTARLVALQPLGTQDWARDLHKQLGPEALPRACRENQPCVPPQ